MKSRIGPDFAVIFVEIEAPTSTQRTSHRKEQVER
jgi:hypothetical protein